MSARRNWIAAAVLAAACSAAAANSAAPARVWTPGHWEWQGNGHVWIPGRYVIPQRVYALRDCDRDGVPDRFDRAPYNRYRD